MVEKLRKDFIEIYFTNISSTKGVEMLSKNIGISKNSLRRFLGKLNDGGKLRISTLNLISEKLGYRNFQDFCQNHDKKETTIDFKTIEIFYESVKGKGVVLGEERYQNVNYDFSEKIIMDSNNLREFIKRFSNNHEALEYVLAWHPCYGRIADKDYQDTLMKMAKNTGNSHLKVFSYSFVFFGKFLSNSFDKNEEDIYLKSLEKYIKQMRKNYHFFWSFPEVRFAIVKCLKEKSFHIDAKNVYYQNMSSQERFIFNLYLSDALNLIKDYENADLLQNAIFNIKNIEEFERENYHNKIQLLLLKVIRGITLFNINNVEEAKQMFRKLTEEISEMKLIPFDIKDYFEIQYYYLANKLFPESIDFRNKLDLLVKKTKFVYFKNL